MSDPRITVLEEQLDRLAGRVACLEDDLRRIRRAFRPEVLERLGVIPETMEPISPAHIAAKEEGRHRVARYDALDAARKNALLDRLGKAERYASRTGKSIAEGWEATGPGS